MKHLHKVKGYIAANAVIPQSKPKAWKAAMPAIFIGLAQFKESLLLTRKALPSPLAKRF